MATAPGRSLPISGYRCSTMVPSKSTAMIMIGWLVVWVRGGVSDELDEVFLDFDGGAEHVVERYEHASFRRAAQLEQATLCAGQWAVDDSDGASHHVGGDFVGEVVGCGGRGLDGGDELLHLGRGHCHGGAVGGALHIAVLQRGGRFDQRVELVGGGADEEQVGDDGHLAAHPAPGDAEYALLQGGEHTQAFVGELAPAGVGGVDAAQVAQHIPLGLFHMIQTKSSIPPIYRNMLDTKELPQILKKLSEYDWFNIRS